MKKILGLDLGTTSIGWAYVKEDENYEKSEIINVGVRVIPLSVDEQQNFEKGKSITTNADRTLKRGARRNLDRYQLRREHLIKILLKHNFIQENDKLNESEKDSTFQTWSIRAKAAFQEIELKEFARVLLHINKKRGYKSSRKAKNEEEGSLIDGMEVALKMYEEELTPGQVILKLLNDKIKFMPDFYPSDLRAEFNLIWNFQKKFYPEQLNNDFYQKIFEKGKVTTTKTWLAVHGVYTAENRGKRDEVKIQAYNWRVKAISVQLDISELAYVLAEINNDLNKTSGYLGKISDRSKELYFNKVTIGEFVYNELSQNRHYSTANQVFYRQDYLDEFEKIWEVQSKFHPVLTIDLKKEFRDTVIFYQRPLKSQKGLISFCEFEQQTKEIELNGVKKTKTIGQRVIPRASPLFQQFKIWLTLGNIQWKNTKTSEIGNLNSEEKEILFLELNTKGKLKESEVLKILGYSKEHKLNYKELEGNETQRTILNALIKCCVNEGNDAQKAFGFDSNTEIFEIEKSTLSAKELVENLKNILPSLGIDEQILNFNPFLEKNELFEQKSYSLWHFLYSVDLEGEKLYNKLKENFGFNENQARIIANCSFIPDYGSLSAKAIRKIFPYVKERRYDLACHEAGYRHSKESLTTEEIVACVLKPKLDLIKRNALRNPVVEKILNQVVNVVNEIIADSNMGAPDEIRIELARELKKNAKEREELTKGIEKATKEHDVIKLLLQSAEFGIKNPSRNDVIRYKLYQELKQNGYKDLYLNKEIPRGKLFSKEIDIEHIIPKSRLFDDSFSNKTLSWRSFNIEKGEKTACDFMEEKFGEKGLDEFISRIESLYNPKGDEGISKAKLLKLKKKAFEIGDGFIERDLRETQYIAKKAKSMLLEICKSVVSTTGSVTDRLREDWGIIDVMKELNFEKYKAVGLIETKENKEGQKREEIKDWTKRNDHRHHAMDAITIAFTKHSHIQYLNHLNARKNESHKLFGNIIAIENKELEKRKDSRGQEKRLFKMPMPHFREEVKKHLEQTIVSIKAKNKILTRNKNTIKVKNKVLTKIEATPRGQLHKETVYGRYIDWEVKEVPINAKLSKVLIEAITKPVYKEAILTRFIENKEDSALAFSGKNAINKKPVLTTKGETVPDKVMVKLSVEKFSIKKDITPEQFKDAKSIEKVLDEKVKSVLLKRLKDFGNNAKEAFANLEVNPIWLNEAKGIAIKSVKISGVSNAVSLHTKKDLNGKELIDANGKVIPTDFVQTGNNHHVAIYRDDKGKLQEKVVSFMEAVERGNQKLPVIDYHFKASEGYLFLFTMKQNELFVFPNEKTDFDPSQIDLLDPKNYKKIIPNVFRVQKIATGDYSFRQILETTVNEVKELKNITWKRCSLVGIKGLIKIRINHLGKIVQVGE